MKKQFSLRKKHLFVIFVTGLLMSTAVMAQLPTAQQIASQMKVGWNLGNTFEAICGETAWNGAYTTQALIDQVKASGFNTVRIPCAWDCHTTNGVIDPNWIARVKEVVDYCINDNLYVILNIHWDGGWLENNVTTSAKASVNEKQKNYWTQIANYFKNYNEHLIFAGTNEPNVEDATGMSVLLSYLQTFIDAVRATGGNNSSRTLIVQGPSTDIVKTNNLMNTLPTDWISNRLMVEVHYYTPYQFCLMEEDASWGNMFYYWGNGYHSATDVSRNATWGEESDVENYFGLMKSKFVDKGFPVIIGEFAAMKRNLSSPSDQALHLASREYFYKYVVNSAVTKGIIPICWDINMQLFDRSTGTILDQGVIDAIMQGAGNSTTTYVTFTNRASGLLIDGMYRKDNGDNAGQWGNSGSNAQQWLLETVGDYVKFKNRATGLYLDGMGRATNGSLVGQWANSNSYNQQWTVEPYGSYVRIKNRASGLYIDGMYWTSNDSDLGQWGNSGSDGQQWTMTGLKSAVEVPQSIDLTDKGNNKVSLFPNPFSAEINLQIENPEQVNSIEVIDMLGCQVEIIGSGAVQTEQAFGTALKTGTYIVRVNYTNGTQIFKIFKR